MAQDMGGKRYTRDEIDQIISLTAKGLFCREIAEKLGRPEQGIRSIRRRLCLGRREVRDPRILGREDSTELAKLRDIISESLEMSDHDMIIIADEINELSGRIDRLEEKMKVAQEQRELGRRASLGVP